MKRSACARPHHGKWLVMFVDLKDGRSMGARDCAMRGCQRGKWRPDSREPRVHDGEFAF